METIKIDIINPKAIDIIKDLAAVNLIRIEVHKLLECKKLLEAIDCFSLFFFRNNTKFLSQS